VMSVVWGASPTTFCNQSLKLTCFVINISRRVVVGVYYNPGARNEYTVKGIENDSISNGKVI
jgi:hypothetical protein